ncbi:protein kinase [Curvibacter sp. CHRR-16]|uniref:protein kinase domain-containing protein n=1 Tax=Curvibacter sp. CHRR-16 TaxID=2835872 RepID=UPI001BDA92C0|nr:protein kinase [Curvibacter sp. CHRR-16]MBT0569635.1 protein kinase [Curvibacter sp. CHRR-16]
MLMGHILVVSKQATENIDLSASDGLATSETDFVPISGYVVQQLLGRGASATVYKAIRLSTGGVVAIKKMLRWDIPRLVSRFRLEAKLCSMLQHPNIVQLIDFVEQPPYLFAVFEYIPGKTLRQHLREHGSMQVTEAASLMMQVLDGLACAHNAGVIHRDLKPENIVITRSGTLVHAKILDFGIGAVTEPLVQSGCDRLTLTHEFLGTLAYSAPEQLRGEPPNAQSDLYAWGLIFLECLTGESVIAAKSFAEAIQCQLNEREISIPQAIADHPLGTILRFALRKRTQDRSPSAQVLMQRLSVVRWADLAPVTVAKEPILALQVDPGTTEISPTIASKQCFDEKYQVTALCCTLSVRSATEGMDVEIVEQLLQDEYFLFCAEAQRHKGFFLGALGDRFVVLFGYPQDEHVETNIINCLRSLMRLLSSRKKEVFEKYEVLLEMRLGLNTGSVVIAAGKHFSGHCVHVAMQLASQATADSLLASPSFCARMHGLVDAEPAGFLHTQPQTPIYQIKIFAGESQNHYALPRIADSGLADAGCVGREAELDQLERMWQDACLGRGSSIAIVGAAGLGKSCLTKEFTRRCIGTEQRVLSVRCLDTSPNLALSPLLQMLERWLDAPWSHIATPSMQEWPLSGSELEGEGAPHSTNGDYAKQWHLTRLLAMAGCEVSQVLPIFCSWLAWTLPSTVCLDRGIGGLVTGHACGMFTSPGKQRTALFDSLRRLFYFLSEQTPLLLIFEDVQAADSVTLEFLQYLSSSVAEHRLLLILTKRSAEGVSWKRLDDADVNDLHDDSSKLNVHKIVRLMPLSAADSVRIVNLLFAPSVPDVEVSHHIVSRAGGVPLFVQELARGLLESQLELREGTMVFRDRLAPALLPASLNESLAARFDQLGVAKSLLQLAATIGQCFELTVLRACITEYESDQLVPNLQRLCRARLLIPMQARQVLGECGRESAQAWKDALSEQIESATGHCVFAFEHALIREAAYQSMTNHQRKHCHAVVADALERLHPECNAAELSGIAFHWAQAEQYSRAVPLGLAHLQASQKRQANAEVLQYAENMGYWIQHLPLEQRREVLLDCNTCVIQALMNQHGWAHAKVVNKIELMQTMLANDIAPPKLARHLWSLITYHQVACNLPEMLRLGHWMQRLAVDQQIPGLVAAADLAVGRALYGLGNLQGAQEAFTKAIQVGVALKDGDRDWSGQLEVDTLVWAMASRARILLNAGYEQRAQSEAQQAVDWAKQIAHVPSLGIALLCQALGYQARGNKLATLEVIDELLHLADHYGLSAQQGYARVIHSWAVGDVQEADKILQSLLEMGCKYSQPTYRSFAAQTLAEQGQWQAAIARIDECIRLSQLSGEGNYTAQLFLKKAQYMFLDGRSGTACIQLLKRAAKDARSKADIRTEAQALRTLCKQEPGLHPRAQARLCKLIELRPDMIVT